MDTVQIRAIHISAESSLIWVIMRNQGAKVRASASSSLT